MYVKARDESLTRQYRQDRDIAASADVAAYPFEIPILDAQTVKSVQSRWSHIMCVSSGMPVLPFSNHPKEP